MDDHPGAQDDHQGRSSSLPPAAGSSHGSGCRSFAADEEDLIIKLHALLGDRWSLIAGRLPGRTDTEVRNYWDTCIKGKLINMGIDPENHRLSRKPVRLVEDSGDTDQVSDLGMTTPTPSLGDLEKLAPEHVEPKLKEETESGSSPTLLLFK